MRALSEKWNEFWFESPALLARLRMFRAVFFGLLALDLWLLMLPHAPRYGVGGFNVSHIPLVDPFLPIPTPTIVTIGYLLGGLLTARVALGLATRLSLALLTAIYGGIYFWSQIDSYQHHYLISLILLVCWFLPHELLGGVDRPQDEEAGAPPDRAHSWAVRLMYVEVSVVYFYTAVTKTTDQWLNGWALDRIITTEGMRGFLASSAEAVGAQPIAAYALTAHAIMIWQYFVAGAFLVPRLRPIACVTGPIFHILVEVIDLKIGWFSYYMIGIYYILLFPDAWFLAVARPLRRLARPLQRAARQLTKPRDTAVGQAKVVAVAAGAVSAALSQHWLPVAGQAGLAALVGIIVALAVWPRDKSTAGHAWARAGFQVAAVAVMCLAIRSSDALYDYHRYWGGDLKRRGQLVESAAHYEVANSLQSRGPARFFQLASVYEQLGRLDDARRAYRAGLRRAPLDERGKRGLERLDGKQD